MQMITIYIWSFHKTNAVDWICGVAHDGSMFNAYTYERYDRCETRRRS